MTHRRSALMVASAALALSFAAPEVASADWGKLGQKKLPHFGKKAVLFVGAKKGLVNKIKVKVEGCGLEIQWLKVFFLNTESIDLNLVQRLDAGGETAAIDLPGQERFIGRIELGYKSSGKFGQPQPRITITGIKSGPKKVPLARAAFLTPMGQ